MKKIFVYIRKANTRKRVAREVLCSSAMAANMNSDQLPVSFRQSVADHSSGAKLRRRVEFLRLGQTKITPLINLSSTSSRYLLFSWWDIDQRQSHHNFLTFEQRSEDTEQRLAFESLPLRRLSLSRSVIAGNGAWINLTANYCTSEHRLSPFFPCSSVCLQPEDVERNSAFSSVTLPDPFMIRAGLKTDEEIAEIRRRRKTGKRLAKYQQKQNDVCSCILLLFQPKTNYIRSSSPLC